jgi:hypothetical protein
MPTVVEYLCRSCGQVTHHLADARSLGLSTCATCGGIRQAVRVVTHPPKVEEEDEEGTQPDA